MSPGKEILQGCRVLVVEDEALVSLMIVDLLTMAGCVVVGSVVSTQEAIAVLEGEAVDCAVLDVQLVDGPSLPVAELLVARGIPFLIATGYGESMVGYNGAPVLHKVFMDKELVDAMVGLMAPHGCSHARAEQ